MIRMAFSIAQEFTCSQLGPMGMAMFKNALNSALGAREEFKALGPFVTSMFTTCPTPGGKIVTADIGLNGAVPRVALAAAVAKLNAALSAAGQKLSVSFSVSGELTVGTGNATQGADTSMSDIGTASAGAGAAGNATQGAGPVNRRRRAQILTAEATGEITVLAPPDVVASLQAQVVADKKAVADLKAAYDTKCTPAVRSADATKAGCAASAAEIAAAEASLADKEQAVKDSTLSFPNKDDGTCHADLADEKLCQIACAEVYGSTKVKFSIIDDPGKFEVAAVQVLRQCTCLDESEGEIELCKNELDLTLPIVGVIVVIILLCCCCCCCCYKCCCSKGSKDGKKDDFDSSPGDTVVENGTSSFGF